ncbi:MAG: hypothetical protein E7E14_00350 [Haemophilus parainfluenzae]|nr:hypothetical protein [Haemophilus parainfluenzae]
MNVKVITGTPVNIKDINVLDVVETTYYHQIDKKTLGQSLLGNNRDKFFNDGVKDLISFAQRIGGNIIFDIRVSTATATFSNGIYFYTTLIATVGKE